MTMPPTVTIDARKFEGNILSALLLIASELRMQRTKEDAGEAFQATVKTWATLNDLMAESQRPETP